LASLTNREEALKQYSQAIDAEQQLLISAHGETDAKFVVALLHCKIDLLKSLDRTDEAIAVMMRAIEVEDGNPERLLELVEWLMQQKAWMLVDDVSARFADQVRSHPLLLYQVAEAYRL